MSDARGYVIMNWGEYKRTDTYEKCRLKARAVNISTLLDTTIKIILTIVVIAFIGVKL